MDWIFTPSSSWDLTELETDDFNLLEKYQTMDDFSNYGISDFILNGLSEQKHSTMSSSSTDSSKRPSAESSDQHVTCLVDGCMEDLSGCRDYHRRHRVCLTHSKTPVVTICGKHQRFCQQCSRFHLLREFDEVKRSCRKRLDGHNRRRRKSRPESMCLNYGSFFTNHQGAKLLHFGGSTAYMTTTKFGSCQDSEKLNQKFQFTVEHRTPSKSYSHFCSVRKRRFRFPFLLGVDSEKVNLPSFQQVVNTNGSSAHHLDELQGVLYLLSSSSSKSNHSMHQASVSGPTNSLVQFNGSLNKPTGPHLQLQNVTGSSSGHTNNQLIGMIQFRADILLEKAAAQVLSYSWN